jgi:hypothetical protein
MRLIFALIMALGACVGDPNPPSRSARDPASTSAPEAPFAPGADPLAHAPPADAGSGPPPAHEHHPGGGG